MSAPSLITSPDRRSKHRILSTDIVNVININVIKAHFKLPNPKRAFTTIPTIANQFLFDEEEEEQYDDFGNTLAKNLADIHTTNDIRLRRFVL